MLQYTLTPNKNLGLTDQVNMALNAGCCWLEINPVNANADELSAIIDLCRDNQAILMYLHDDELLEQNRVHGIHLCDSDTEPLQIRQKLGGHPIIGVDVTPDTPLIPLKRADVDYLVIDGYPEKSSIQTIKQLKENCNRQDVEIPIVVKGCILPTEIASLIEAGASGINIDINSLQGPDYAASLSNFMSICSTLQHNQ